MSDDLDLPKEGWEHPPARKLTMEEYLDFITWRWNHAVDWERVRAERAKLKDIPVVPFEIKNLGLDD